MKPPADPLSPLLAAWRVAPASDPGFRRAVWARLHAGVSGPTWAAFARRRVALVGGALAAALVAGVLVGHGSARARVDEDRARLASAYVAGLDARLMLPAR